MSSLSDISGLTIGGLLYGKIGPRLLFIVSNGFACLGGIVILFYGLYHQGGWTIPVLVFVIKLGIAC